MVAFSNVVRQTATKRDKNDRFLGFNWLHIIPYIANLGRICGYWIEMNMDIRPV